METNEKEIRWSAPEFHYYSKGVSWYWLVFIGAIVITTIALLQGNFLFAVFIVIAATLAFSWGKKNPETLNFSLSENGLDIIGKKFYHFKDLAGFTIIPHHENPEISELILKKKSGVNPWIKIIIASQRSEIIYSLTNEFLPEIEYSESLADHIAKRIKF